MMKVVERLIDELTEYEEVEDWPSDVLEEIEDIEAGEVYDDEGTLHALANFEPGGEVPPALVEELYDWGVFIGGLHRMVDQILENRDDITRVGVPVYGPIFEDRRGVSLFFEWSGVNRAGPDEAPDWVDLALKVGSHDADVDVDLVSFDYEDLVKFRSEEVASILWDAIIDYVNVAVHYYE